MAKKILLLLLMLLNAFFFWIINRQEFNHRTHTITLKEDGYHPEKITVLVGDTINFVNQTKEYYWPASNLHPTHTIYSDFDPKRPLAPDEAWAFTFTKTGDWQFHDHLAPYYTGVIHVVNTDQKNNEIDCTDPEFLQQCWRNSLDSTLKKDGLNGAFDELAKLYEQNSSSPTQCHGLAHDLGIFAYRQFSKGEEIDLSPKTAICNFGFYHGFMDGLFNDTDSLEIAQNFCKEVDAQMGKVVKDSLFQCYHGIGHGAIESQTTLGNPEVLINNALKTCEDVSSNQDFVYRCVSGIFNGIANFYVSKDFGLKPNTQDPLWLCRDQTKAMYKRACYTNMSLVVFRLHIDNPLEGIALIKKTVETPYQALTLNSFMSDYGREVAGNPDVEADIGLCRNHSAETFVDCLNAYITGLIDQGVPEKEYELAISACNNPLLDTAERSSCFVYITPYLRNIYPPEKFTLICQSSPDGILPYCQQSQDDRN